MFMFGSAKKKSHTRTDSLKALEEKLRQSQPSTTLPQDKSPKQSSSAPASLQENKALEQSSVKTTMDDNSDSDMEYDPDGDTFGDGLGRLRAQSVGGKPIKQQRRSSADLSATLFGEAIGSASLHNRKSMTKSNEYARKADQENFEGLAFSFK